MRHSFTVNFLSVDLYLLLTLTSSTHKQLLKWIRYRYWQSEIRFIYYYCFTFSNKSNSNVLRQVIQNKCNWEGLLLVYPVKIVHNCILFIYTKMATFPNNINVIYWKCQRNFCVNFFFKFTLHLYLNNTPFQFSALSHAP